MNSSKQIKYGAVISYVLIALNIVLGLVYTPWILREIGSSHYGLYTLGTTSISLFTLDFGIGAAVTRFVAKYRAENNQEEMNEFLGVVLKIYFLIMIIISIVLFFVFYNIDFIYANLTVEEISIFKIVYTMMAFFIVLCFPVNICNGVLNAYEQFIILKGSNVFNKLGTAIVSIVILLLHGGLYGLVLVNGIFNLVTFIIKFYFCYRYTNARPKFVSNYRTFGREFFSYSMWTTILNMSQRLIFNIMPTVLAMVTNTMAITLYGFANSIEGYVYTITTAMHGLFLPRLSKIVVDNNNSTSGVLSLMIRVGRINHSVAMLLLMGVTILGQEFVELWVGAEYLDLYYCILALAYPYFISASQQIAANTLVVVNKVKYSAIITAIIGLVNIVSAYIVAPRYGIIGVCVSTGLLMFVRIVVMNIVYYRELHINLVIFFKECQIKLLPALIISGLLSKISIDLLFYLVISNELTWGGLVLKAIIICIIYLITMWLIGWNDYEKKILCSFIVERKKR